ncbi:MAG: phosphoribosylformylglycinamidine synthase I [Armatimonadota bacterium]
MKFGIIRFPGSNCDEDCHWAVTGVLKQNGIYLWHDDEDLKGCDCVILPGGFSYGDYLRTGGVARFSRIMKKVAGFADKGGLVMGICNGFQVLCEAGLLPGAFLSNLSRRFICKDVHVKVINNKTTFTVNCEKEQILKIPVAHGEGRFYADRKTLKNLHDNDQVILKYCSDKGNVSEEFNPNGSTDNIAGICNKKRNIFGLMPHPERCCEDILGSSDGLYVFKSILNNRKHIMARK